MEKTEGKAFPYGKDNKERLPLEHYLSLYGQMDPHEAASRLRIDYNQADGYFVLKFLGSVYHITWPDFQVSHQEDTAEFYPLEEETSAQILVARYFLNGKASTGSGKFFTYSEMPWGDVYERQFHGRCILRLAYGFGNKLGRFRTIMERMGGEEREFGDASYEVCLLEGYRVQFILWEGDEEFPPSSQILFSDNFPDSFEAEDMAVTGDVCIDMMKVLDKGA